MPVACLLVPATIFVILQYNRCPWAPTAVDKLAKRRSLASSLLLSEVSQAASLASRDPVTPACSEEAQLAIASRQAQRRWNVEYGLVDRIFLKHWNPTFGDNAQLAVRSATFALIAGLPLIFPESYFPWLQPFQKIGFWSVGAITLFIFTIWKTVGETLSYAWFGIFGTLIATLDVWVMFGIFPGGVTDVSPPFTFWAGVVNGVLFITIVLWLNLDDNTKIFALLNFVWFWMAFMDPNRPDFFSQAFALTPGAADVSTLLSAISGSGLAITATLLPFPLWALRKACRGSHEIAAKLGVLWEGAVETYCSSHGNAFQNDHFIRDLKELHQQMLANREHIRNSWWECFGCGSWQRVRLMLYRLHLAMQDDFDRIYCVLNTAMNTDSDRSNVWELGSVVLEHEFADVIEEAHSLLAECFTAACHGGFRPEEELSARAGVARLHEAITILTSQFRIARKEQGGPKLNEGLMDEHAFCYNVCALGRLTAECAEDLLQCQSGSTDHMPKIQESVGFWGIFDRKILFDPYHILYVVRTSLRILVCFLIGYHGYSNVVRGKNAGIAIPATLLLMRYMGSAIQKNAKRLQAVVLSTVVGVLIHVILGRCVWWGYMLVAGLFYVWLVFTLFLYFDSVDHSYSGLLMAYFGTMGILRGCSDLSFDPGMTHFPITNTVVAICVVTAFDVLLHPGRAAPAAHEAYLEVWRTMKDAVGALFDPTVENVVFHRNQILSLVAAAEGLGNEAAIEPRLWRVPWPHRMYEQAIQCSFQLCACVSNMENTVARAGCDGAPKDEVFQAIQHLSGFQGLGAVLREKMEQMEGLLKIFLHERMGPMEELESPQMMVGYLLDESKARKLLLEEVTQLEQLQPSHGVPKCQLRGGQRDVRATLKRRFSFSHEVSSVECEPASQVSLFLSDVEQMVKTMRALHHAVLRY